MSKKQRTTPKRSLLVGAAAVLVCLLFAFALAASRTENAAGPRKHARRPASAGQPRSIAPARQSSKAPTASAHEYDIVLSRNLFKPTGAPAQAKEAALPPMPPEVLDLAGAGQPKETQQQPQWVYAGYATVNSRPVAIVENAGTKMAQFVGVGDKLDELKVIEVTPTSVKLAGKGETVSLSLSSAFTATPLNAPPKAAPAATGRQGRQGFGGGPAGGLYNSGLFQNVILPALRDNPQYADEARQFMSGLGRSGRMRFGGGQFGPPPAAPDGGARQGQGGQQ